MVICKTMALDIDKHGTRVHREKLYIFMSTFVKVEEAEYDLRVWHSSGVHASPSKPMAQSMVHIRLTFIYQNRNVAVRAKGLSRR